MKRHIKNRIRLWGILLFFTLFLLLIWAQLQHFWKQQQIEEKNKIFRHVFLRCARQNQVRRIFINGQFRAEELTNFLPNEFAGKKDFKKLVIEAEQPLCPLSILIRAIEFESHVEGENNEILVTDEIQFAAETRIHIIISNVWLFNQQEAAIVLQVSDTESNIDKIELLYFKKPENSNWKLKGSRVIALSHQYDEIEEDR